MTGKRHTCEATQPVLLWLRSRSHQRNLPPCALPLFHSYTLTAKSPSYTPGAWTELTLQTNEKYKQFSGLVLYAETSGADKPVHTALPLAGHASLALRESSAR